MIDGYDPVNDAVINVTINPAVQLVKGLNVLPKNMINRQHLPLGCLRRIKFASMNILRSLLCKKVSISYANLLLVLLISNFYGHWMKKECKGIHETYLLQDNCLQVSR